MMSALECFHHAVRCEEEAEDTSDGANKAVLLEAATHWRKLGAEAKARDVAKKEPPSSTEASMTTP